MDTDPGRNSIEPRYIAYDPQEDTETSAPPWDWA